MTDFDRIKALFPMPCKCNVWIDVQNGFQGMITSRGAYRMRRIVRFPSGLKRYEIFSVTKAGGMKSTGYAMCEAA